MPAVSKAQLGFMAMSRTAKGRAMLKAHGKKPAPASVASEYVQATKGKHNLPKHVRARKGN